VLHLLGTFAGWLAYGSVRSMRHEGPYVSSCAFNPTGCPHNHSLLVMGSMNSSGSILLQGSSGPSPIAAAACTSQHKTLVTAGSQSLSEATVPAAAAPPAASHLTHASCCAVLSQTILHVPSSAPAEGLSLSLSQSRTSQRLCPSPLRLELPPYLRKSSTGTTMVVWMVGRTCVGGRM
jgi:hypothetical protein